MPTIKLLSWHEGVAAKADLLKLLGVTVNSAPLLRTSAVVGELAGLDPAVLVLDLDRRASYAREIALMVRASKSARHIPILLAGSEAAGGTVPARYAHLASELPDLPYAAWPDAQRQLSKLLEAPRTAPHIVPPTRVYTASLAQKLGILPGIAETASKTRQMALIGAPEGFVELLGNLPGTVMFVVRLGAAAHLALCFIRSSEELAATLEMLSLRLPLTASAWIVYPKRTAGRHRDFDENDVRGSALAAGFVDYKICSIDAEWSAMKFARRKAKPS